MTVNSPMIRKIATQAAEPYPTSPVPTIVS